MIASPAVLSVKQNLFWKNLFELSKKGIYNEMQSINNIWITQNVPGNYFISLKLIVSPWFLL